ncbi:MAG: 6-phospho-3-hexuloisomerase [Archaeoglobaceae archaeon]
MIVDNLKTLKYDLEKVEEFLKILDEVKKVFLIGIGRSGFVARAFAMRLMHLGYSSYVIGETVTPRIESGDLLIAISGSGETGYVVAVAKKAKKIGAKVISLTSSPNSSLSKISDVVLILKNSFGKEVANLAPLGTLFEITAMIFLDAIVAEIMKRKNISESDLAKRHTIENEVNLCLN